MRRAGETWACYSGGSFLYLSPTDRSSSELGVVCTRVDDLLDVAKLDYYAAKLLVLLSGL